MVVRQVQHMGGIEMTLGKKVTFQIAVRDGFPAQSRTGYRFTTSDGQQDFVVHHTTGKSLSWTVSDYRTGLIVSRMAFPSAHEAVSHVESLCDMYRQNGTFAQLLHYPTLNQETEILTSTPAPALQSKTCNR